MILDSLLVGMLKILEKVSIYNMREFLGINWRF